MGATIPISDHHAVTERQKDVTHCSDSTVDPDPPGPPKLLRRTCSCEKLRGFSIYTHSCSRVFKPFFHLIIIAQGVTVDISGGENKRTKKERGVTPSHTFRISRQKYRHVVETKCPWLPR
jgi:hypothetical protein